MLFRIGEDSSLFGTFNGSSLTCLSCKSAASRAIAPLWNVSSMSLSINLKMKRNTCTMTTQNTENRYCWLLCIISFYTVRKQVRKGNVPCLPSVKGFSSKLKLPSLFIEWLFWTFHNKSHNMKALVILHHSDHHLSHVLVYMKKVNFVWPSGVFSQEKTPSRLPMQITWLWPPVGRSSHGLITIRPKKMWTSSC